MTTTTIIPDIHADPFRLEASLNAAGSNQMAFLGDFIDAGKGTSMSDDLAVLKQVRKLIDDGRASAVMGNHELNAILYHREDQQGRPLRAHSEKNQAQHKSFLDQFDVGSKDALQWTEWFLTLPLWQEDDRLRLVHACWDQHAVDTISSRRPDGRLHPMDLEEVAAKETPFALAVEKLTSGPEIDLPQGYQFHDSKDVPRQQVRIAWWRAAQGTWRDVALSVPNVLELPDEPVANIEGFAVSSENEPPVLVGHYKMQGDLKIDSPKASCIDFPEAPCVYHWSGETALTTDNLVRV